MQAAMSPWLLAIVIFAAWGLWGVAGALEVEVQKRKGELPADAGFSFVPFIPVFPLVFVGGAMLLDLSDSPGGARLVAALHGIFAGLCVASIVRDAWRIRR